MGNLGRLLRLGELEKNNGPWYVFCHFAPACSYSLYLGNLLLRRLLVAIPQARQMRRDFLRFTETLEQEDPAELAIMKAELAAWEVDKTQADPYRLPKSSESHQQSFSCPR